MTAILRTYRVHVHPRKVGAHEEFERNEGVPMVRSMEGCIACGFGRVQEAREPTYVFFSLWRSKEDLELARASPTWKAAVAKLEGMGVTIGSDISEHVEVRSMAGIAMPK
jgi:quinol monooxygenase YgiN